MTRVEALEVSVDNPIPKISLRLYRDQQSGLNLYIHLMDFQLWPPELNVNTSRPTGHGHLHISGKQVRRLYGPYQHLAAELFKSEVNLLMVSLSSHDHRPWMRDGVNIQASCLFDLESEELVLHSFSSSPPN